MTIATITFQLEDAPKQGTRKFLTIKSSYDKLVQVLGEPTRMPDDSNQKVSWDIYFSDGERISVYDWSSDVAPEQCTEWNVAADGFMAASRIYDILEGRPIFEEI